MAKSDADATLWTTLLSPGLYKRNQGKLVRQLTMAAVVVALGLGIYSLWVTWLIEIESQPVRYAIPAVLAAATVWLAYRLVNHPPFAEFLIDVEGEMAKVTWPSRDELMRATVVVLVVMFLFSFVLFGYDIIWQQVLRWIRVLQF